MDTVVALTLAALVGGGLWHYRAAAEQGRRIEYVRESVNRIEMQVKLRSATEETELNARGWPTSIDPEWFMGEPPRNTLLSPDRPWLEVAPSEQADLRHPPMRIALHKGLAAFWYNPGTGVVRARAPVSVSDRAALRMYNEVNESNLDSIFSQDESPSSSLAKAE